MYFRDFVSCLTLPSVILLASLGYSCATNKGDLGEEKQPPAAKAPAAKLAATQGSSPGAAKKVESAAKPLAKPQVLPTPPKLTATAAPSDQPAPPKRRKRAEKVAKTESKEMQEARVTRYVAAQVLNVRSKPGTDGEIVGRLTRGSQLPVEIKGEWAKIGDNQFVQTKFLSAQGKSVASAK